MNKPIELAAYEFNQALVELINNSRLPAFIVAQSLQGVLTDVTHIAEQHLEAAKKKYEEEGEKNG